MADSSTKTRTLVLERVFDAPRGRVWEVWTTPEHIKKWWGPKGFTAPIIHNDFKVGGKAHYVMRDADGKDYWSVGTYKEIVPGERIVVTDSFADSAGNVVPASYYGMEDMPLEMLITVTFEDAGAGKTRLTIKHSGMPEGENGDMAKTGWNETLDKLATALQQTIK